MQATSLSGAPDSSVTRILNFCSGAPQETAQSANNNTAVRFTILVFIVTIMARGPETPLLTLKSMMPVMHGAFYKDVTHAVVGHCFSFFGMIRNILKDIAVPRALHHWYQGSKLEENVCFLNRHDDPPRYS
jgi:hypothetical protein